ncbi:peptidase M75 [Curtobacterium sp. MCBD17_034]|uniref:iron uptake system protein EfeO n=1 Tax=unclassified Curtobacterium TaxID=257496 RepID=UPI000DA83B98|nr:MULTISPECIES: iron uptake system protein EfeO [unclassified Curtobacterium]PZF57175.1 peptidase M75 [Curtobacterium sp. MCBD17_034]PZF63318.1 peptidase M75 [Curtobacterium sp. MCBD17_013]PZM33475.1 peptidase M75 [Curtobacterium sp. MCBD17_031]
MPFADRRTRSVLVLGATLAAAALALTGCSTASSSAEDAATPSGAVHRVAVTLTNDGSDKCAVSTTSVPAGPVTFTVRNTSSTAITEVELLQDQKILGEKENLAPGLDPVKFTVTLGGGKYQVYCPGATKELTTFTVTGKAASTANSSAATLLRQGAKGYADYVDAQVNDMVTAVRQLQEDVDAGDLAAAKTDYANARPYYEHVESDVDGFVKKGHKATDNAGNLDYLVDMRASNLDPSVGWHGFHAVERDLFQGGAITASTKQLAAELTENVTLLDKLVPTLTYKPEDLANGAAGLLEEVQSEKITGEEEGFSHIDLVDLAANVEGARQAFAYLKPGLQKLDPSITKQIATQFDSVDTLMDGYRDGTALGGFRTYDAATRTADANTISQTIQALQDPLSRLAEKVATA